MPTPPLRVALAPLAILGEKVLWTYVQALIALLTLGDTLHTGGLTQQLAIAALPAALTVLANGLPQTLADVTFAIDIAYRIVRSFAVMFVGVLLAVPIFSLEPELLKSAWAAGLVAALAVVKGVIAKKIGASDNAATLPNGLLPGLNGYTR